MKFELPTLCVHAGTIKDEKFRGINSPIYTSTSYEYIDRDDTVYPRYFNTPNEQSVAQRIAELESCEAGLVFSSGMAAISTVLFTFLSKGDHAVFQKGLYGGTSHFLASEFERFGISYTIAASQEPADIEAAIRKETRLIYVETPSNPLLRVTDLAGVAAIGKKHGILTMVDNTFASPVNQQPHTLGIDIVMHSATKYLGGHSDICAGAVLGTREVMKKVHATSLGFGGSLNAITLYLLERSIKTLDVRMQRINSNAGAVAAFLAQHPSVARVNYPGLPEDPGYAIACRQMRGFGGMLSFELRDADSLTFQKKLKLIRPSMSLGGSETIVSSPVLTSHRHLSKEERQETGITDGLIRFSAGLESQADLIDDLDQALG